MILRLSERAFLSFRVTLAFIVDCDGATDDCLAHLVRGAGDGLRR